VGTVEPLAQAIREGFLDVLRCLVRDLGADVNQAGQDGSTPLTVSVTCVGSISVRDAVLGGGTRCGRQPSHAQWRYTLEFCSHIHSPSALSDRVWCEYWSDGQVWQYRITHECQKRNFDMMQYLLEEADARMDDVNNAGKTV
jgi:hypothetical protein